MQCQRVASCRRWSECLHHFAILRMPSYDGSYGMPRNPAMDGPGNTSFQCPQRPLLLPEMFGPARRCSVEFPRPSVAGRYSSTGFAPQSQGWSSMVKVKESQPMSNTTTYNNSFLSPSASCVPLCIHDPFIHSFQVLHLSFFERRRTKSRGFPIQQEHRGLNRESPGLQQEHSGCSANNCQHLRKYPEISA